MAEPHRPFVGLRWRGNLLEDGARDPKVRNDGEPQKSPVARLLGIISFGAKSPLEIWSNRIHSGS